MFLNEKFLIENKNYTLNQGYINQRLEETILYLISTTL